MASYLIYNCNSSCNNDTLLIFSCFGGRPPTQLPRNILQNKSLKKHYLAKWHFRSHLQQLFQDHGILFIILYCGGDPRNPRNPRKIQKISVSGKMKIKNKIFMQKKRAAAAAAAIKRLMRCVYTHSINFFFLIKAKS